MNESPIRCGVIGVGRMGTHHARVYSQMSGAELVGVVDTDTARSKDIVEQWGGKAFETTDQLLKAGVDAVTIATPTVQHRADAELLLSNGVGCLIEKPLAPDVEEASALVDAAHNHHAILQVGHIVRYDPVIRAISKLGKLTPRFIEMDRISPMTFRSIDVGVVLDMMIHDLDLLFMLVGCEPEEIYASAVSVLGDAEDVCNARLIFPSGTTNNGEVCVANLTASRLALKTERKLRVITEDAYISTDFVKRSGTVVHKKANASQLEDLRKRIQAGEDLSDMNYLDLVQVDSLDIDNEDALQLQIRDFLDCVRTGRAPVVDAQTGFAAVRTAERIVSTARKAGARMV